MPNFMKLCKTVWSRILGKVRYGKVRYGKVR